MLPTLQIFQLKKQKTNVHSEFWLHFLLCNGLYNDILWLCISLVYTVISNHGCTCVCVCVCACMHACIPAYMCVQCMLVYLPNHSACMKCVHFINWSHTWPDTRVSTLFHYCQATANVYLLSLLSGYSQCLPLVPVINFIWEPCHH